MWTECDEVADRIVRRLSQEQLATFARSSDATRAYIRSQMPDEREVVLSNIAESLHLFCNGRITRR
jgi:hypothetical protein